MLFIDANRYLDLYRMENGAKLLDALEEQKGEIFVTAQIVSEVERNKVKVGAASLAGRQLKLDSVAVPHHLVPPTDSSIQEIGAELREIGDKVQKAKENLETLSQGLMERISRSEDEVSKRLATIFSSAIKATDPEIARAMDRKTFGRPPGKQSDPLGDQINWEQLLTRCRERKPKIWIISKDSDYATKHNGKLFLNAELYSDLRAIYGSELEVFCFESLDEGIRHFVDTTKAAAKKLPTMEESKRIHNEEKSLPPLGWLTHYDDYNIVLNILRARESEMLRTALANELQNEFIFPIGPGDPNEKL